MLTGGIGKAYRFIVQDKNRHALRVRDVVAQFSLIIAAPRIGVPHGKRQPVNNGNSY